MKGGVAAVFPLGLLLAIWPWSVTPILVRVTMAISVAPAVYLLRRGAFRNEAEWAVLHVVFLSGLVAAALPFVGQYSSVGAGVGVDLARQAFLSAFSVALAIHLRLRRARRAFMWGMALFAFVTALALLVGYLKFAGWELPTYHDLRRYKKFSSELLGVPINPLSFAMIMAAGVSIPLWYPSRWLRLLMVLVVLMAGFLSGSRASIAAAAVSVVIVIGVRTARRVPPAITVNAVLIALTALLFLTAQAADVGAYIRPYLWSEWTAGRFDLWVAGVRKFLEQPLTGWGSGSWRVDLHNYLPGYYQWGRTALLESAASGGFHNMYITVLAERGILGFVPSMAIVAYLIRLSFSPAIGNGEFAWNRLILPFLIVLMLVRGIGEHGGLLGYGSGIVDFMAFGVASFIVASQNPAMDTP